MVHAVENGVSHKSRSTPNGEEHADGDSLSPMYVKQEPSSPGASVSVVFECYIAICAFFLLTIIIIIIIMTSRALPEFC